jgi:hypothetical protein
MSGFHVTVVHEGRRRHAYPMMADVVRGLLPSGYAGAYMLLAGQTPIYIGRSDTCVRTRLASHPHMQRATHFVWEICRNSWHAFVLESALFHSLQHAPGMLNLAHPARPSTDPRPCPFCTEGDDQALRRVLRILN